MSGVMSYLFDGNSTAAIDTFCDAWIDDGSSSSGNADVIAPAEIWNHAMTKTVGWTIVMLLKTILFERKFDRWSGIYRFLNLGSTFIPFAMAVWTIYNAMGEVGEGGGSKEEKASTTATMMILWRHVVNTPMVRNWVLTGLAWALFHRLVFGKIRSSKVFTTIEWVPGILAGILSLACWIVDETSVAAIFLGAEVQPNTLLIYATLMRWAANTVTSWYCYAEIVTRVFGTNRFTSFPWYLMAVYAGRIVTSGGV
jgi:hypothetical protein